MIPKNKIGLIVDSGCDLPEDIREKTGAALVPLEVSIEQGNRYIDDGAVDILALLNDMKRSALGVKSACPSVEDFAERMRAYDEAFVITLSSNLSGSYAAARLAADMVMEEYPEKKIYVFDSKSASAGEVALLLYLWERIESGLSFDEIIPQAEERILRTRTLFVLKDLTNLIKNGRMGKLPGLICSALSILPIMGDDGDGKIKLLSKVRGLKQSHARLVDMIKKQTAGAEQNTLQLVLGYCNCQEQAAKIKEKVLEQCAAIRDVIMVPTGAIASMYANDGGIVVAFWACGTA